MTNYGAFAKEVAITLDINPNTLRRWSLEMEKQGYKFTRNEKEQRIYYDRDVFALSEFKRALEKTQSLENAAKAVVQRVKGQENAEKTLSVIEGNEDKITVTKEDLGALIEQSVEKAIEKEREAMFKAFETKMNETIEHRDRYLVHQLNESMEQKRLEIAAAQEQNEEKKKGFWSRLLGK